MIFLLLQMIFFPISIIMWVFKFFVKIVRSLLGKVTGRDFEPSPAPEDDGRLFPVIATFKNVIMLLIFTMVITGVIGWLAVTYGGIV